MFDENSVCLQRDSAARHLGGVGQTDEGEGGRQDGDYPSAESAADQFDWTRAVEWNLVEIGAGKCEYYEDECRGSSAGYFFIYYFIVFYFLFFYFSLVIYYLSFIIFSMYFLLIINSLIGANFEVKSRGRRNYHGRQSQEGRGWVAAGNRNR